MLVLSCLYKISVLNINIIDISINSEYKAIAMLVLPIAYRTDTALNSAFIKYIITTVFFTDDVLFNNWKWTCSLSGFPIDSPFINLLSIASNVSNIGINNINIGIRNDVSVAVLNPSNDKT